jgi:hypothetical protein
VHPSACIDSRSFVRFRQASNAEVEEPRFRSFRSGPGRSCPLALLLTLLGSRGNASFMCHIRTSRLEQAGRARQITRPRVFTTVACFPDVTARGIDTHCYSHGITGHSLVRRLQFSAPFVYWDVICRKLSDDSQPRRELCNRLISQQCAKLTKLRSRVLKFCMYHM